MHIRTIKRKKGAMYQVSVQGNGQVKTRCFDRKIDGHRWGLETENLLKGTLARGMSFKRLSELWFENHCLIRKAPSSIQGDKHQLKPILKILGDVAVEDVTARDIDRLVAHLKTLGKKSNKTINRYVLLVQTICNYGVRIECLLRSPVRRDHFLPEDEVGYRFWREDDAEKFLAYAKTKYAENNHHIPLVYSVALNTGLRWGEIIALKWDAIYLPPDQEKAMITVKRSYCNVSKRVRETTKSHKVRYIGVNKVLYAELVKARDKRNPEVEFLFHTEVGSALRVTNFNVRHFRRDVKAVGVPKIRFHDMRHTYASHFVMNGGSIYDLQKILGHSDIQTTMRYAHLAEEHILSKSSLVVLGKQDNVIRVDFSQVKEARL